MRRNNPALTAALSLPLALASATAAPSSAAADRPVVTTHTTLTNELGGVYRSQKFVYAASTTYPQGAPAGTVASLQLDEDTPLYNHGKEPSAVVVDRHGNVLDLTVTTVEQSESEFRFVAAQPLPRHATLRVRVLAVATAQPGDAVSSTFTAGWKSGVDTDAVRAMPKVTAIQKNLTDGREQASPGDTIEYVATGSFTGEVIDGTTLLLKQSPLAPVVGRPTVEVRDASGSTIAIDPERLLYSKYGDSLVLTILGGVPQGATFTVRARAAVSSGAVPGDVISTEFGIGLNNWIGGKLSRAVDTTAVV